MLPINFEGARWIGKPPSMTDEECYGMPAKPGEVIDRSKILLNALDSVTIDEFEQDFNQALRKFFNAVLDQVKPVSFFSVPAYHFMDQSNYPQWVTAWKPNVDDLKALNEGGAIWIKSLSEGLIPMAVYTINENNEANQL